jgi:hypothetical protein
MSVLLKLSGSTDGKNIKIAATATPGTLIHTAHATLLDRIFLWACNTDSADRKLTLEHGGVTAPDDISELGALPFESGWIEVCPGLILTNSLILRGFAATANVVVVSGYVLRG